MAGEITTEWELVGEDNRQKEELLQEANKIVPYHMQHNAEAEACDLLMEIEHLELLTDTGSAIEYNSAI